MEKYVGLYHKSNKNGIQNGVQNNFCTPFYFLLFIVDIIEFSLYTKTRMQQKPFFDKIYFFLKNPSKSTGSSVSE